MTHCEVRPDPALSHYLQGRPERERRNQECRRPHATSARTTTSTTRLAAVAISLLYPEAVR
jgi:hypothetical protein